MICEYTNRENIPCTKVANKICTKGKWNGKRLCNVHFSNTIPKKKKPSIQQETPPTPTNSPETPPLPSPIQTETPPTPTNSPETLPHQPVENVNNNIDENLEIHPHVQELFKIPKHEQRSKEWFAERHQRLTASDVATALGMNPYSSRADLIYKKCGGKDVFKGNAATAHGQKWEDTAIRIYCEKYNDKSFEFGLLPHPTIPFLGGSPDGITAKGIVLEVKCPLGRQIIPGLGPSYYLPQVQIVMECTNLEVSHFIQYKPPPNEVFDVTVVPRDRDWFARYFPVMDFFWREVTHYREIGLEYNPVHIKKEKAEKEKAEKKKQTATQPQKPTYMFQDDE